MLCDPREGSLRAKSGFSVTISFRTYNDCNWFKHDLGRIKFGCVREDIFPT